MPVAAARPRPRPAAADPAREAALRLARALPARTDAAVLVDLLEDDLREGLEALAGVEAHFTDVLDALRAPQPTSGALLAAGDDAAVRAALDTLERAAGSLRRRLGQAAGLLRAP